MEPPILWVVPASGDDHSAARTQNRPLRLVHPRPEPLRWTWPLTAPRAGCQDQPDQNEDRAS